MNKKEVKNKSSPKVYVLLLSEYQKDNLFEIMDYLKYVNEDYFNFLYHLSIAEFIQEPGNQQKY